MHEICVCVFYPVPSPCVLRVPGMIYSILAASPQSFGNSGNEKIDLTIGHFASISGQKRAFSKKDSLIDLPFRRMEAFHFEMEQASLA